MGIDTNVYTIYGWKFDVNKELSDYLEEIDYDTPDDFITDMDGETAYMGAVLFDSGNFRWGEMDGESTWTEDHAEDLLGDFIQINEDFVDKVFSFQNLFDEPPKYISFVNFT